MVPFIVGTPTYAGGAAISSLTLTVDTASLQAGDVLVAPLRQQAGSTLNDPDFASAGFARLGPAFTTPNTSRCFGFFAHVVTNPATEPSTRVFTTAPFTRASGAMLIVRGVDLVSMIFASAISYSGTASGNGRLVEAFGAATADALGLFIGAAEFTVGISHVPTVAPSGWTQVASVQSSMDNSTAGSRTGLWAGSRVAVDGQFPQSTIAWSANPSASGAHAIALRGITAPPIEGLPVEISIGGVLVAARAFVSIGGELVTPQSIAAVQNYAGLRISDLLSDDPFYVAHRCGGANWPEFSQRGIENSIAKGYKALEYSVWRSATGEFVLSHDFNTTRMTGVNYSIPATPWSTLSGLTSTAEFTDNTGQSRTPLLRLTDALAAAPGRVIFIDHKATSSEGNDTPSDLASEAALMDYLETIPGAHERFVWKVFKDGFASAERARARGFKTWVIYYDAEITTAPTHLELADIVGVEWNDTQAQFTAGTDTGKPVLAHIITNAGQRDSARTKGADGFMNSNVTLLGP